MRDIIFIRGLALEAIIGLYAHERLATQPLFLDLDMTIDSHMAARSGQISDTVDYDAVATRITEVVSKSDYELLESLIEKIVATILLEFNVYHVKCTVYKPKAIVNAQTVGITIERSSEKEFSVNL